MIEGIAAVILYGIFAASMVALAALLVFSLDGTPDGKHRGLRLRIRDSQGRERVSLDVESAPEGAQRYSYSEPAQHQQIAAPPQVVMLRRPDGLFEFGGCIVSADKARELMAAQQKQLTGK